MKNMLLGISLLFAAILASAGTIDVDSIKNKAEKGDAYSQGVMAGLSRRGIFGVKKDEVKSLKWATHSAVQNNPIGIYNLAVIYDCGIGVKKEPKEALSLYKQALPGLLKLAEEGDMMAQYDAAYIYLKGKGAGEDPVKALNLIRKSAEQGYPPAEYSMGYFYMKGMGEELERDSKKAIEWMHKAADQEDARAQLCLAGIYCRGDGVERDVLKAYKWARRAADHGDTDAESMLGAMFLNGIGTDKNFFTARKYLELAANKGDATAQCNLGVMYYKGEGVKKDYKKAYELIFKSAEQNNALGQYYLGLLYENGDGVEKNYPKAMMLYKLSASQNCKLALDKLEK